MAGITTKLQSGYENVADGGTGSRSWGNINSQASDEALVQTARVIYSLQDKTVKKLVSVKRVDTTELNMPEEV